MPREHRVAVVPGDGIGTEVMPVALDVLRTVAGRRGFTLEFDTYDWSCERYAVEGHLAPDGWLDALGIADAILLGAVGWPGVPDHVSLWDLLVPIRRAFDQYINLRPLRSLPNVPTPLAGDPEIDLVIVRENSEGEYTQIGGRIFEGTRQELAIQEAVFSRRGIERVVRYACVLAQRRRGHLIAATKSNGLFHSMPYWDEVVREIVAEYDVDLEIQHIDALAARFVTTPQDLDVVVASNLFGDILSDLGAALIGSLGLAPSANLNPSRGHPSMFEPVHGSAPDIAGRGVANPLGQVLSAALMLDHLGEAEAATDVTAAVHAVLRNGSGLTGDMGGSADTGRVGAALQDHLTA